MNRIDLKKELELLGIDEDQYSLYGDLKLDSIILYHSYDEWQVFYLDERGRRDNYKVFNSEEEACLYIYKLFSESIEIKKRFGLA